jgi:hypothetical protein
MYPRQREDAVHLVRDKELLRSRKGTYHIYMLQTHLAVLTLQVNKIKISIARLLSHRGFSSGVIKISIGRLVSQCNN